MAKQIQAFKWSDTFKELMAKKNLNLEEYEFCLNEWKGVHESKIIRYYIYTIVLFCGGLWAVYTQLYFLAVLLLALAANYNRQSSHHMLIDEVIELQRLSAKLINKSNENSAEQKERERIEAEINEFAESHPYFEELEDRIASLISEGMSLEDAYHKALTEGKEIT